MTITLNVRTVNVLAQFEGNNTLNIIIFPVDVILGSVAQWSRNRFSVQMAQVRFSSKLFFSLLYIYCFVLFLFLIIFSPLAY